MDFTKKVKVGDNVEIMGMNKNSFKATVGKIETGTINKILLQNLGNNECEKGQIIYIPGKLKTAKSFDAKFYVLKPDEGGRRLPFKTNYKHRVYITT